MWNREKERLLGRLERQNLWGGTGKVGLEAAGLARRNFSCYGWAVIQKKGPIEEKKEPVSFRKKTGSGPNERKGISRNTR